jgi:hypothetical protein
MNSVAICSVILALISGASLLVSPTAFEIFVSSVVIVILLISAKMALSKNESAITYFLLAGLFSFIRFGAYMALDFSLINALLIFGNLMCVVIPVYALAHVTTDKNEKNGDHA